MVRSNYTSVVGSIGFGLRWICSCGACGGEIGVMKKFISLQEVMMSLQKVKVE